MSWLSQFLGDTLGVGPDSGQAKAIGDQKRAASQQLDYMQNLFSSLDEKRTSALDSAISSVQGGFGQARARLGDMFTQQQAGLQNLFSSQRGQFQSLLGEVLNQGRQQAARSGLIGGSQEAGIVNPAIQNLTQSFATQGAQAQLGLLNQQANLYGGLESQNLGLLSNLFGTNLQQIGGLQQAALGGLGGAYTNTTNAAGYYNPSLLQQIGNVASAVGSIYGGVSGLFGKG